MYRVFFLAIVILLSGCGDCNREVADVPYQGDPTATDPYVEAADLEIWPGTVCDADGCNYHMTGVAWFHNPLQESYTADVVCEFWDDNYQFGASTREDVTVDASRSKQLEFDEQYETADQATLRVECDLGD